MTDFQINEIQIIMDNAIDYIENDASSDYSRESAKLVAFDEIREVLYGK